MLRLLLAGSTVALIACSSDTRTAELESDSSDSGAPSARAHAVDEPDGTGGGGAASSGTGAAGASGGSGLSTEPRGDAGPGDAAASSSEADVAGPPAAASVFPPVLADRVPAFLAQGHMGRTLLSCDDGRSWVADQSADDSVRCFEGIDCDHHAESATGLAYGDGYFVSSWGWGNPGTIRRSPDGIGWEEVHTEPTYNGVAYGNGVFIAGSRFAARSVDSAASFSEVDTELGVWTPRGTGFAGVDGGRFVIGGGGNGEHDVVLSSDDGVSWWRPMTLPDLCGDGILGITGGGGAIVISRRDGTVCTSHDGGTSFRKIDVGPGLTASALWTGDRFMVWGVGHAYESDDGVSWTANDLATETMQLGAVALAPTGTFVAVRGGWMLWYEEQRFYRSKDGKTWEELAPGSFVGSHPIRRIVFGYVEPSAACPLPE